MSSLGARKFFEELSSLLQRTITVATAQNKKYVGTLTGFDPATLSLCLSNVKEDGGKVLPKLFINGNTVGQILATERPFNIQKLSERLDRVFPKLVKLYEDAGVVVVMDKIRVTPDGILEGSGPAAERVKKVYDEFVKETQTLK
ncbi:MAG: Lsm family RNA-binding protein [Candidatus Bathyarchaeota archaeon]